METLENHLISFKLCNPNVQNENFKLYHYQNYLLLVNYNCSGYSYAYAFIFDFCILGTEKWVNHWISFKIQNISSISITFIKGY